MPTSLSPAQKGECNLIAWCAYTDITPASGGKGYANQVLKQVYVLVWAPSDDTNHGAELEVPIIPFSHRREIVLQGTMGSFSSGTNYISGLHVGKPKPLKMLHTLHCSHTLVAFLSLHIFVTSSPHCLYLGVQPDVVAGP